MHSCGRAARAGMLVTAQLQRVYIPGGAFAAWPARPDCVTCDPCVCSSPDPQRAGCSPRRDVVLARGAIHAAVQQVNDALRPVRDDVKRLSRAALASWHAANRMLTRPTAAHAPPTTGRNGAAFLRRSTTGAEGRRVRGLWKLNSRKHARQAAPARCSRHWRGLGARGAPRERTRTRKQADTLTHRRRGSCR